MKFFKSKKSDLDRSLSRRPENEADRETLLSSIVEAHHNGDINDADFFKLFDAAKKRLSDVVVREILARASTAASIIAAVAEAAGFALSAAGADQPETHGGHDGDNKDENDDEPDEEFDPGDDGDIM